MDARLNDIVKNKSKNLDKIVLENYSSSFLSNTKWHKLINGLTTAFDEIFINYKLVYDEVIEGYLFDTVDFIPYFIEPIQYKEVEWIEIPKEYEYWLNRNNLKAGKTIFKQDVEAIVAKINEIGKFKIDQYPDKLKLYAYQ